MNGGPVIARMPAEPRPLRDRYFVYFGGRFAKTLTSGAANLSVELMNIYVANIAYSAKDQDLRELFEAYGEVTSAKIIMDKATNRSRGFGFVEMADDNAGRQAIEGTNGKSFHGRDLVVNEARPRTEGDRPFRGGGGDRGGFRTDRGRHR